MARSEELKIETPLRVAELADAQALVGEAGWNQIEADWRIFLDLGRVYVVRDGNGRVIATAATLPHDGRFAWISMVLVSGQFRRLGLARRLMRRCIDDLSAAGLVPVLDATPAGREVYRALGFQDSWSYQRLTRPARAASAEIADGNINVRPIDDTVWAALCAYDAAAFGASRERLLARLRGRLPAADLCALRGDTIAGFMLGRDGRIASHIGPLIAGDDMVAQALLARALARLPGPVFLDLADAKRATGRWLAAAGFTPARPLTRMLLGRSARFDDPRRTYAVVGPEFG
ncbi:MAG: GNAT family N-acetyltransferase [Pseudorhodoplanes sp.]|nr:MAG: GNAT family N-acetyltransferase [Pseudorhodoplanes sp.]